MERLETMVRRPGRTLMGLATILAALAVAVGSGATFTAQSANPANTLSTGTLTMSNSGDGAAVLSAAGLKPGDSASGTVDIENTGSLAGAFSVSRSALTSSDSTNPLADRLELVLTDCGGFAAGTPVCGAGDVTVYSGTLGAMSSAEALGTYAAGEKRRYELSITLDASAGNAYQGDSATATFRWDASQA